MRFREDVSVWGLVSDVHGNHVALEVALRALERAGATRLAFLGDYLGRCDPERCVRRIREVADVAIVGNRDLDWQERVSPESKAWVLSLPRRASVAGLLLTHGDARLTPALSTSQIARDFVRAWPELELAEAQVWAFGHSHHARLWRKASAVDSAELLQADTVSIERAYRYFLNVGTTGLPFPGKGDPSVGLVDLKRSEIRQIWLGRV